MSVGDAQRDPSAAWILPAYHQYRLCDAPFPGGSLTTRQPTKYSWMSGNPTPLMKIG